ncbi:hypothetical protein IFU37_023090 (plasmid) [Pantoea agglomerans]|uniref:hypothetical protein n=1 Tax=Enterobacter agglomerans TaxID=549 RepID=UPI0017814437|nr:hypothetical protein [Pantoea agglomerans]WVL92336.1 hypothetical protein IFU37_023090 [Pantoea agglomerans]
MNVLVFKNGNVSIGDVFASSWGYEQTNVNFYQVVSTHGKKTVTVREIRAATHLSGSMDGYKTPVLDDFIGECLKRQVKVCLDELAIKIEDFETAYKTAPGKKNRFTSYY